MKVILIMLAGFVICVPVFASLTLCAPKWWAAKVAPHLPHRPPRPERPYREPGRLRRGWDHFAKRCAVAGRVVVIVALSPHILAVMYIMVCSAVVKQACPYNPQKPGENIWDAIKRLF